MNGRFERAEGIAVISRFWAMKRPLFWKVLAEPNFSDHCQLATTKKSSFGARSQPHSLSHTFKKCCASNALAARPPRCASATNRCP